MIKSVRGTYDILPDDIRLWHAIEREMRAVFESYAFGEIRTPIFESKELFVRGVGPETDIVSKEMYTFTDKSEKSSFALRPEGTAPVVRSYIEHRMSSESRMIKLYYIGPMFRCERPQRGRFRQFYQAGVEVLSSDDNPAIEAEVIEMLMLLFERLGVKDLKTVVNSIGCVECRALFIEKLRNTIHDQASDFCDDCNRRTDSNPLRVFDCKAPSCQPLMANLPTITDNLCDPCREHFKKFQEFLNERGIAYLINKRLVRGLDYYMRTTFEILSGSLGAQDALVGGGRYDGLTEALDGPPTKGFGFAMGLDRLLLSITDPNALSPYQGPEYFLATLGDKAFRYATLLARKLRAHGSRVYLDFDGRSLKSQMRLAGKLKAVHTVIIGEEEMKSGKLVVRDMETSKQEEMAEPELLELERQKRQMLAPEV